MGEAHSGSGGLRAASAPGGGVDTSASVRFRFRRRQIQIGVLITAAAPKTARLVSARVVPDMSRHVKPGFFTTYLPAVGTATRR